MSTNRPTPEQERIIDAARSGDSFVVQALAGTGKTTTMAMATQALPRGRRVIYTAFNRKIVEDAKGNFPAGVKIKTNHSLAFQTVGTRFMEAGKLSNERKPTVLGVLEEMGWTRDTFGGVLDPAAGTYLALSTVNRFCGSPDARPTTKHVRLPKAIEGKSVPIAMVAIRDAARKLWLRMSDPSDAGIPANHDVYLKLFCLNAPQLPFDTIVYDEAQDASGAVIGLLAAQRNVQIIPVGDDHQSIYGWRGAHSAMHQFGFGRQLSLTQSFRFGPAIAEMANLVLDKLLEGTLRLRGDRSIRSRVAPCAQPQAILARTNATLIAEVVAAMQRPDARVALVGGVTEPIRLVEGVQDLQEGRQTRAPDLYGVHSWNELVEFSQTDAGAEFKRLVDMVQTYGCAPLIAALRRVQGNEHDEASATHILSTAHRAKGRQWSSVAIADDFAIPEPDGEGGLSMETEEANLIYVAYTRARHELDVTRCGAAAVLRGDHVERTPPGTHPRPGHEPRTDGIPRPQVNRMPRHWAIDVTRLPPDVRDRIQRECEAQGIDITEAISRLLGR